MVFSRDSVPVPPNSRGFPGWAQSSRPVPWGPSSPLWPGMAMNSAPKAPMSTGRLPADWAASRIKGTPAARHRAAISCTGRMKPNTLDTWVNTAPSIPCRNAARNSSSSASRQKSRRPATVTRQSRAYRGRITALCSKPETSTRLPGLMMLSMAMFSPWVQLAVSTTCSGLQEKSPAACSRQSKTVRAASMAAS